MGDLVALPAELLEPSPPLTDDDLERLGVWAIETAADTATDVTAVAREAIGWEGADLSERLTRWEIDGPRTAAWAMAKLREYLAIRAEIEAQAAEWIANIQSWAKVELARRRVDSSVAYFEAHLEYWGLRQRAADPKVATLALPSGKVATTAHKPKAIVTDEAAAIGWVERWSDDFPEVLVVKKSISLTALRKVVTLIEVPDAARVVFAPCGCVSEWTSADGWIGGFTPTPAPTLPGLGDGVTCPSCGDDALVGQLNVTALHHEVEDANGNLVPGVGVEQARLTARVDPVV